MQNGDRVNFTACTNIPSNPSDSTFYAQLDKNRLSIGDVPVGDGRDIVINVVGTQTQPTASWIGGLDWPSLPNGLKISYYLPYENTGDATLDLTLPDNTSTGAVPIYFKGDVRLTTQFNANSTINLTYFTAGSISIAGQATTTARWVCSDTIDAIQSIEPSDELGYIETTNTAGHTEKISPYYGTAPSAAQQMPFNFTSVKSSNLEDYTIYGNNNPNHIDETRTTLPMTVSAYGGNATDWEIYGNNNPVVETITGTLPLTLTTAKAGAADTWTIYGNDDNGTENILNVYATNSENGYILSAFLKTDNTTSDNNSFMVSEYFPISPNTTYALSSIVNYGTSTAICFYDTNKVFISGERLYVGGTETANVTTPINAAFYRTTVQISQQVSETAMIVKGSTAPDHFIPYQKGVGERTEQLFADTVGKQVITAAAGISFVAIINNSMTLAAGRYTIHYYQSTSMTSNTRNTLLVYAVATGEQTYESSATNHNLDAGWYSWTFDIPNDGSYQMRIWIVNASDEVKATNFILTKGETATPTEYIPYGYQVPLIVSQTGQTDKTYDIYIGDSPLTEGETVSKQSTGVDLELFEGENTVSTTLYNKPNTSITYNSSVLGVGEKTEQLMNCSTISGGVLNEYGVVIGVAATTNIHADNGSISFTTGSAWRGIVTDFTEIKSDVENITLTYSGDRANNWRFCFYDNSRTFISQSSDIDRQTRVVVIPNNTKYFRASAQYETAGTYSLTSLSIVQGSTAPATYIPWGYQIPISVTSGQTTTPYNYYIGNSPLTAGQSISKSSMGTDIALLSGTNTISTTLGNKPEMRIDYESAEVGVGVRTVNLFDESHFSLIKVTSTAYRYGTIIGILPQGTYTLTATKAASAQYIYLTKKNGTTYTYEQITNVPYVFTADGISQYILRIADQAEYDSWAQFGYSQIMLVEGSTAPTAFEPYGYKIPIAISQDGQTVDTKNIYIGTSLLTQGQSITKTQAGVDIYAPRGVDTMDSTLYNKPSMSLVATCGIDGYIDNKLDMFNNQQVIPKIQALHDKLKLDMDQRFGFPNGGYNWMYYYGKLSSDDGKISLAAADIGTNYYGVSANNATSTSYTIQQKFNALTIADDSNERYIRALPEGDYRVLVAFGGWTGTAGAATFELEVDVTHSGSTTTSTITEASPYYYWEGEDITFYYADIHVDVDTQEMGEVSIYDAVTLNYNFASSTSDYSDFDGAPIWVWIAEVGKFESEILPDFEEMVWGLFYPVHNTVATDVNKLNQRIALVDSILSDRITTLAAITNAQNAGAHNAIYRGKYLGTSVLSSAYNAIDAGTFDDLYVGDYWTINGVNWRIAAIDYYLNSGSPVCTTHHLVIVPDTVLYDAQYHITQSGDYESGNIANTTAGGYQMSDMRTGNSSAGWDSTNYKGLYKSIGALGIIEAAFGAAHILQHRQRLVDGVNTGRPSAGAWFDSKVELMSETNVYGCRLLTSMSDGSYIPYNYTIDKSQYPLFAHRPDLINIQDGWWLRDVASDSAFAYVDSAGCASEQQVSYPDGVRPAFCICKANPVTEP